MRAMMRDAPEAYMSTRPSPFAGHVTSLLASQARVCQRVYLVGNMLYFLAYLGQIRR